MARPHSPTVAGAAPACARHRPGWALTGFPFNAAGPSGRAPGSRGQYTRGTRRAVRDDRPSASGYLRDARPHRGDRRANRPRATPPPDVRGPHAAAGSRR